MPTPSVVFRHFRFPVDDGDLQERLDALIDCGWEHAGGPRDAMDLSGRRVLVYRMRTFPETAGTGTGTAEQARVA